MVYLFVAIWVLASPIRRSSGATVWLLIWSAKLRVVISSMGSLWRIDVEVAWKSLCDIDSRSAHCSGEPAYHLRVPENTVLVRSQSAVLGYSRCGGVSDADPVFETEEHFTVVLPLSGFFNVDTHRGRTTATPAKVILFSKGQTHRISHPGGGGDRSAYITMEPDLAEPGLDHHGEFRAPSCVSSPAIDLSVRRMLGGARHGCLEPLELDEFISDILALLLQRPKSGEVSEDRHRALVTDAEEYLSLCYRGDSDLATIAAAIGASPHHLSRLFRRLTGETLSRRRMRLRLGFALDQILEGADDLATVAIEAGFYDHAHLANSFRTHFGQSPDAVRSRFGLFSRNTS